MSKLYRFVFVALCLALLAPAGAQAQQSEPSVYTFVAEWAIPRDKWDQFTAEWEKNSKPTLEKLSANGTLVGWGTFAAVVHEDGGITHGTWWAATSIAGIERARTELIKQVNPTIAAAPKHRDYLLHSLMRGTRATGPASGYLWVSTSMVQPGKGQDWRAAWEKYNRPVYEQLLKDGTITYYALEVEQVHTEAAGLRFAVYITPNADGIDKVNAAFQAANQKRSEEERRAIGSAFADLTVPGTHRDSFSWIASYWTK